VALGAPGCGPRGVGTRACGRRPSASTQATACGPRERPETATEPPAALGGPAAPRAPPRHGRRCRKFLERSKMSQHSRPQVRALRASRGLPGYEGDCHGSRRRPAPTRRARRAHNRAWVCWALASGRPPHREERAGVQ
jgi:hypothetical protein